MAPIDVEVGESKKTAVDEEEQETIDKKEAEVDKNAGREVFNVNLDADAGRNVADDRLRHAVDPDGLSGEGVLKKPDSRPSEGSGNRVASRDSKEDGDDQRKIEDGKSRKRPGEQRLQKDRPQRDQQRDGRGKAVLL